MSSQLISFLQGVKIKMDDAGNVLIRRYSKGNVYVKSTASQPNEETSIGNDIMKLPSQALEMEKIVKVSSSSSRNSLIDTIKGSGGRPWTWWGQ